MNTVCLRNISINTVYKGDDDDDDITTIQCSIQYYCDAADPTITLQCSAAVRIVKCDKFHIRTIYRCAAVSFTVKRQFSFTMTSTAAMPSGVTTGCA